MNITRDVVSDLWPLYAANEASPDTRALVDEFLRGDPDFARRLATPDLLAPVVASLPPEAEARALVRTRDLLNGRRWLRGLRLVALALTGLTVARFIEHTSWNQTTRMLAANALVAAIAWIVYVTLLYRQRARTLGGAAERLSTQQR